MFWRDSAKDGPAGSGEPQRRQTVFSRSGDHRRFYAVEKFTPEQVRQDESRVWKTTKIFYGGKRRKIRYKVVAGVHWQRGRKQRPLRLIVIAPTPYRKSKSKKLYYRDPAYLWTTDLRSSLKQLLQIYFDRWQIEVNHREEKDTLGVGQAQLWECHLRAQTASLGRGCLQCSVAGFPTGFRRQSAGKPMPSFPSGGETPAGLPAWI